MANPVLVEVMRGQIVESRHRGSVAVFDADGGEVLTLGDVDTPMFPRSAVKAIQALPLIETGAADTLGFGDREIALACASHNGEPEHAALAASMLAKAGLPTDVLECGAHWPLHQEATVALAQAAGQPNALHNNCSGKHSGFVCTCAHLGLDPSGYVGHIHPSQQMVREAMQSLTGIAHDDSHRGTDGCSIPTYAVPLRALALAFARMAGGTAMGADRVRAARRIMAACMAEPFFVAGTGRFDTRLMSAAPGRIFAKVGAEGVYCAALPEIGLGIALKCDDGAARAAETMIVATLATMLPKDDDLVGRLSKLARPDLTNWNGITVGAIRPCGPLSGLASAATG